MLDLSIVFNLRYGIIISVSKSKFVGNISISYFHPLKYSRPVGYLRYLTHQLTRSSSLWLFFFSSQKEKKKGQKKEVEVEALPHSYYHDGLYSLYS